MHLRFCVLLKAEDMIHEAKSGAVGPDGKVVAEGKVSFAEFCAAAGIERKMVNRAAAASGAAGGAVNAS